MEGVMHGYCKILQVVLVIVTPPLAVVRSRTGVYSVSSGGDNVAMVSVLGCVFLYHDHPLGLGQPG